MGEVTALTTQKRNRDRVNVYLDGSFAFGLDAAVAASLRLGQRLTSQEIAQLQQQDVVEKARQDALRLISYRPRSVAEVERKLRQKGYDEQVIAAIVERLQNVELLGDEAFARYWVEQRETFKPRSRIALRQELAQKGVSRNVIEQVLTDLDETAAARHAATRQARRWRHLPEEVFRVKLGQFLQRRGFHYEVIYPVIDEVWQALSTDTPTDTEIES